MPTFCSPLVPDGGLGWCVGVQGYSKQNPACSKSIIALFFMWVFFKCLFRTLKRPMSFFLPILLPTGQCPSTIRLGFHMLVFQQSKQFAKDTLLGQPPHNPTQNHSEPYSEKRDSPFTIGFPSEFPPRIGASTAWNRTRQCAQTLPEPTSSLCSRLRTLSCLELGCLVGCEREWPNNCTQVC